MILAPLADNLLTAGTLSTAAEEFYVGAPGANLFDDDPRKSARWRSTFVVVAGVNDSLKWNDGAARSTTLTAGVYNSAGEFAVQVTAKLAALTAALYVYLDPYNNRWQVTGASVSLTIASDAASAWSGLMGFRNEDRSSAATHPSDFAAVGIGRALVDLGSSEQFAEASFLARVQAHPGAAVSIDHGTTSSVADGTVIAGDAMDTEVLYVPYSSPISDRYVQLTIADQRREESEPTAAGYWYHGPVLDTDALTTSADPRDYDIGAYTRGLEVRSAIAESRYGHPVVGEKSPAEAFALVFSFAPGLTELATGLEAIVHSLGVSGLCFVALDPDNEPHRESYLCRLASSPAFTRAARGSKRGTWSVTLEFDPVELD